MYQFRDPIHGFIDVSSLELKIIDSKPFQRLHNIKQLATTYLVYHGAEHTRFGHSLGTMHLVTQAFNNALNNYQDKTGRILFNETTRKWYTQILRLIALTHDLGHAPFSHASEALFDDGIEHEDFTKKIITETEISTFINDIGKDFQSKYGEEYSITPELLWMIYGEKNPELNSDYKMPDYKFLRSFMDSELDCDKMDYLLRDSYYCGVNYGRYDLRRLITTLNVYKEDNILLLGIEGGGLSAFEEFVIARYFMFIQVYFHKTRRYLDKLLVDCIKHILPDSKYPNDVNEYLEFNDEVILSNIKEAATNEFESAIQLMNRKIMSCVYQTSNHHLSRSDDDIYRRIKKEIKAKIPQVTLVTDSAEKLAHKIPVLEPYNHDSGKGIPILIDNIEKPSNVLSESLLLQSLDKPINIKRIYVDKESALKAKEIVHEFFKGDEDEEDE